MRHDELESVPEHKCKGRQMITSCDNVDIILKGKHGGVYQVADMPFKVNGRHADAEISFAHRQNHQHVQTQHYQIVDIHPSIRNALKDICLK